MRLSTKIAYNTIIQVVSKFIATGLGLAAIAVITRHLGQAGFGQYTTIITFLSIFAIMADLGLTLVTVQMISRPGVLEDKILSNLFGLRLVSALIFLVPAPFVVLFFPYDPIIKLGVAVAAFSFLFIALNQILVGVFQKNLRMDKVSIAEVGSRIILVIGVSAAAHFGYGLVGILIATTLASAFNFLLHYLFSLKFVSLRLSFDKNIWREIIIRSWPLALTIALNLIYLKTDTLILSLIRPQAEVGIYGAAYKVIDVLITIPFMFAGIVLPIITLSWAEKNFSNFKNILQKSFDGLVVLALPLAVGAQFTAKHVMILVAGQEFSASAGALKILIMAAVFIFLGSMFIHGIVAIGKPKKLISVYIFTGLTAVIGYLIFIPKYSYFGAAWVTIYSEFFVFLASAYILWKYTKFLPNLKIFFKSLFAAIVMGAALYKLPALDGIYQMNLFLVLLLAIAVYFVVLYVIKGLDFLRENI